MPSQIIRFRKAACLLVRGSALIICVLALVSCAVSPPLIGLLFNNIRQPLTEDLHHTPMPVPPPSSGNIMEIREPFTGLGFYGRVHSNAMGPIAKEHAISTLYFADEEFFSVLGIWSVKRVQLYGD